MNILIVVVENDSEITIKTQIREYYNLMGFLKNRCFFRKLSACKKHRFA